jgi:hypothetical protein
MACDAAVAAGSNARVALTPHALCGMLNCFVKTAESHPMWPGRSAPASIEQEPPVLEQDATGCGSIPTRLAFA